MDPPDVPDVSRIVPLALPKGSSKLCELCQSRASLECAQCRVTFYCNASHQLEDWVGIHEKICPLLVPLRTETLQSATREERIELDKQKRELIVVARSLAEGKLAEGKHEEAIPAGLACLRLCIHVFGPRSIELLPASLILAEAHLGLGKLSPAAEMLSQAEWTVSRSPDCGHELQQRLHLLLGLLQASTGDLQEALLSFSNHIYHAAEVFGPDSSVCTYGLFHLAVVFAQKGETTIARSLFKEVAQTLHSHLNNAAQNPETPLSTSDKPKQVEVDHMLQTMLDFEQSVHDLGLRALLQLCLSLTRSSGDGRVQVMSLTRSTEDGRVQAFGAR